MAVLALHAARKRAAEVSQMIAAMGGVSEQGRKASAERELGIQKAMRELSAAKEFAKMQGIGETEIDDVVKQAEINSVTRADPPVLLETPRHQ